MSAGARAAPRFDLATREGAHALLEAAVATPSPSGDEAAVARLLVDAITPYVDRAWIDAAGNARAVAGAGPRSLLLLGHLDTVPGWVPVRIADGVLYGRGSVDAKGSAVAAAVALARSGPVARAGWTLHWAGAVEEEVASSRGARHLLVDLAPPDRIVIGEPSGAAAITLGYKGRLRLSLHARRPLAHSARADVTASEALVAAWSRVHAWVEETNAIAGAVGAFDRLQASLLQVGSGSDGLEEWADGEVAFRLPPSWSPERLRATLAALDLGPDVEARMDAGEVAVRGARDGALARAFRVAIRASGARPATKVKTGTSDWNVVAPVWDADVVAYGPGDASLDHTPNEHLPLDEFDRAVAVLGAVLGAA